MNPVALFLSRLQRVKKKKTLLPFRRPSPVLSKMNSSTLLARPQTAARPSCTAQQRKGAIEAMNKRSAMRQATAAACSVAGVAALAPASSSSIDARRRLFEKVISRRRRRLAFLPLSIARDPPRKLPLHGGKESDPQAIARSLPSQESHTAKVSTTEKTRTTDVP